MAKYLIQGDTLSGIADAIRLKAGVSDSMTPDEMPAYIQSLSQIDSDIPEDIVQEAQRLASAVHSKMGSNTVTFLAMSDMHEMGDGDYADSAILERYRRANLNAGQGAKLISDAIDLDFFAFLGDFAWGSSTTTISDGVQSIRRAGEYVAALARNNVSFLTPGNHDPLTNSYEQNGTYLNGPIMDGLVGSYRYADLEEKKLRVVCLNTAEVEGMTVTGNDNTECMTGAQLQWFAESLDLSGKEDAADWSILILSHHPLDWGQIAPAADCLEAYVNGESYTATHNGVEVTYDFTGKNAAAVIGNFHGHTHCLNVNTIGDTTVQRIAIPNACYARNNEYGEAGNYTFGEESSYEKTDDSTGKNTAFCVVTVDLDSKIIYADCFGAGYDRILNYDAAEVVTYSVSNQLVGASTSNGSATVLGGASYSAEITADSGFAISDVTVTMGGEDVTDSVYADGVVSISAVTGDIVITVSTTVVEETYDVTNLMLTSEAQDSTDVYNGIGYKNGVYASESGDGTDESCVATGWIPYTWSPDNVIYVRGATVSTADHVRFYGYSTKNTLVDGAYGTGSKLSALFTIEELEEGNYYCLTPRMTLSSVAYIRISLIGTGENLIITVNEPIVQDSGEEEDSGTSGTYTNLVSTAVATDGETVFNETGYMDGAYASTPHYGSDAACVCTGFIWLGSDVNTIYVKGATWDTSNSHCRIHVYSTLGSSSGLSQEITAGTSQVYFTFETLEENYYKISVNNDYVRSHWYCISLVGTGENLIITHDEPIG